MINTFIKQHQELVNFHYDIFDRIILSGWVCYLQKENNFVYFMKNVCGVKVITPYCLKKYTHDFIASA